eukprot:TRINITY_DN9325_c0_g1_i4.p1 TRINITY_DN9325_c0_g1~~TRINITY_DN9325_c0_g1_i4.p1  ORF type:complete len:266 (-),score=43.34 TRINITY_DN9325_c0_g1_i4:34-792(-)
MYTSGGTIRVRIISANSLTSKDLNGYSDPYCEVSVNHQFRQKTRKVKRTLNPQWHQSFDLPVHNPHTDILHFTVKDWDRFSRDDIIGSASMVLNDLIRNQEKSVSLPLRCIKNMRSAGVLNVAVTAMNFGRDLMSFQTVHSTVSPPIISSVHSTVSPPVVSTSYQHPVPMASGPYMAPAYSVPNVYGPPTPYQTAPVGGYPNFPTPGLSVPTYPPTYPQAPSPYSNPYSNPYSTPSYPSSIPPSYPQYPPYY